MPSLFSHLINRFQLRILLYLLVAITLPLFVAIYVGNHQFSSYSERAMMQDIDKQHDQLVQGVQRELSDLTEITHRLAADYGILSLAKRQEAANPTTADLNAYVNSLLSEQTEHTRYIEQACLTVLASNRTLCAQAGEVDGKLMLQGKSLNKRFEPLGEEVSHANAYLLTYSESMIDRASTQELGKVIIWINMNKLMKEITGGTGKNTSYTHVLLAPDKRMVYRDGVYTGDWQGGVQELGSVHKDGTRIYSVKQVDVIGNDPWLSYYDAPLLPDSLRAWPAYRIWLIVLIGLVIVLSLGGILLFISTVTKPLYVLKALMNRAERGDLRAYWTFKSADAWMQVGQSYNQMLNRLEDLIKQVKREESLKKEAEMEALHYQLNPHFLYNTLNTIKWVAKLHKTPQISEVVSALVRLLQASLGKKGDFITLRDEMGLTHDYMAIQRFRYGDRIQLQTHVDDITLGCLVPRMLLQPLVENAIIHGIGPTKREGVITIRSWLDRDLLFCQVEDNGVGMQVAEGSSGWEAMQAAGGAQAERMLKERMSGVGISHIREKIKLIYGPEFKMHITSKPGEGTTVRMFLPIHQGEE
ncbi:sensor histidine kinase [Paenibacillus qinlingensis]|uniref:histidine kinase n=1 Tax=Paenibacillus qinlingensis TaxID=1837343 RepID=A0ABU1P1M1_9BACL|nr:sensor histidine kinase [Paenibacillus qinlingensis]MDR6552997.1 signal transduction histidine kinase [Paenibacillus qinlingensis]